MTLPSAGHDHVKPRFSARAFGADAKAAGAAVVAAVGATLAEEEGAMGPLTFGALGEGWDTGAAGGADATGASGYACAIGPPVTGCDVLGASG